MNLDFNDVKTVLENGGVAIMSTGYGEGEERVKKAIDDALNSPLLNDNDIFNSKKILLNISFCDQQDSKDNFMMDEINYVHDFLAKFGDFEIKWGVANDPELGKKVKVTILATGFGMSNVDGMQERLTKLSREDATKLAEEQEREARNMDRREKFYGGDNTSRRVKRRPNIYIYRPEDLDNDDIISAVEQTPTYKRTREILESIGQPVERVDKTRPAEQQAADMQQGVISFV
jgi:cell division protein FtsZ